MFKISYLLHRLQILLKVVLQISMKTTWKVYPPAKNVILKFTKYLIKNKIATENCSKIKVLQNMLESRMKQFLRNELIVIKYSNLPNSLSD
jgi:hypothetical protein